MHIDIRMALNMGGACGYLSTGYWARAGGSREHRPCQVARMCSSTACASALNSRVTRVLGARKVAFHPTNVKVLALIPVVRGGSRMGAGCCCGVAEGGRFASSSPR